MRYKDILLCIIAFFLGPIVEFCTIGAARADGLPTAGCKLTQLASLDAITQNGQLLIPVKLDGRLSYLRVDTGAPIGIINQKLVTELKLQEGSLPSLMFTDASGAAFRKFVMVHELQLGSMVARNVRFLVAGDANPNAIGFDGTFDANFLTRYDVELDLAHGKFNLFSQDHCKGQVVYWSDVAASTPIHIDATLHTIVPVTLDGKEVQAMLDTGATVSTLSQRTASRLFGIDPQAEKMPPDGQVRTGTGRSLPFYSRRFASFQIGGVEFRNTELKLMPDRTSSYINNPAQTGSHLPEPGDSPVGVIIGLHHLEKLRIYIAYGERMLYVTAADAH